MRCVLYSAPATASRKLLADPEGLTAFFAAARGAKRSLRLEKSWHGLHYVLTGTAGEASAPLGFLLSGGEPVGEPCEEDEGEIPARLLLPGDVQRLSAALAEVNGDEFGRRFDPERLAAEEIYLDIWVEPREDLLSEYRMYFESLKRFVRSAAKGGEAILVLIG
jgi:hypothetical protein